jgi:hypothetical protein
MVNKKLLAAILATFIIATLLGLGEGFAVRPGAPEYSIQAIRKAISPTYASLPWLPKSMTNRAEMWPSAMTTKSLPENACNVIACDTEILPGAFPEILVDVSFNCRRISTALEIEFTTFPSPKGNLE